MAQNSPASHRSIAAKHKPQWFRSLRARLLVSVNTVVILMVIGALVLDYRHQLRAELNSYQAALSDEARSLIPGVLELKHHGLDVVQRYIDAVCATMQDESSPGHHIVIDLGDTTIQAKSHHRASAAILGKIKDAAASPDGQINSAGVSLVVGVANGAGIHAYVAEETEPVISRIRGQVLFRLVILACIGLIGALLVNVILVRLVTRPVGELVRVVRRIGAGELGALPDDIATEELDVLATEIGRMSADLEHRERDRAAHLHKAQRLQEHLLPRLDKEKEVAVAVVYRPADTVAGDYYDVLTLPDGSMLVCIADVCGHGVPAAMGVAILKTLLLAACEDYTSLPTVFQYINKRFLSVSLHEDFATMALLRIEPASGTLEYASAGHEPSYLLRRDGQVERLDSTGMLLGVSDDAEWTSRRLDVSGSDRIIMLTDGVSEAPASSGLRFGRQQFTDTLQTLSCQTVERIARELSEMLARHCADASVGDDQTILVLNPCPVRDSQRESHGG